jgi:uncharacterized protein (DUF362 family)
MESTVAVVHETDIAGGIEHALDLLGDLRERLEGKHVAIKPNDTWASRDDLTACTQADTLRAVIRYVKRFAPSQITVTGGAGAAETGDVFALLGLDTVIEEEGVGFFDHNRGPFQSVALDYGPQKEVMVNPQVLRYDTVISLAQHKVHYYATVTLCMKNIAFSFPAADYYGHPRNKRLHPHHFFDEIHGFIAGMCKRFPPAIGIIVGHPAMIERGPIGGFTFESELVLASTDFVAVDAVGAALLGKRAEHIAIAEREGLGTADMEHIVLRGESFEQALRTFNRNRDRAARAAKH